MTRNRVTSISDRADWCIQHACYSLQFFFKHLFMAKFNVTTNTITINKAGGQAYSQEPKLAFLSILLTSFVKNQYYRSEDETLHEVSSLIDSMPDKKFVAKAAIFARTKFGMRSITHVVAGELAKRVKGETWAKDFFDKIIYRPDDMTEILACYKAITGMKLTHAIRKGFAKAITRFDSYQLAKYKNNNKAISLVDIARLVHPKNTGPISQLMKGTLPIPETWETQMTATKGDEKQKKQVWEKLIKERKIGYFALLRNLRNIIEQAPEIISESIQLLTNEDIIRKSLVLPFRYLTAIDEIEKLNGSGVREVLQALNIALDKAVGNVPEFAGDTLVVLDVSGSMAGKPATIGALFAAVLYKSNNADLMVFSDDARYITLNPVDSTLTLAKSIRFTSGGTNFHAIFEHANKSYDRIFILSDMQGWIGNITPVKNFNAYKQRTGANPFIYSFDLQGYGTMQFPQDHVYALAGFSEKIFDIIKLLETDKEALMHEIEKIEL